MSTNIITKRATGLSLCVIGVLCVLGTIWLSDDFSLGEKLNFWSKWILPIINTLGTGLFCSGIISILIETKSWNDYFAENLKKIIVEHEYLSQIDTDTLSNFHKNVLRIRYKNEDIGKDDTFLDFQQQLIEPLLIKPYRENVEQIINIHDHINNILIVDDQVKYQFRTNKKQISEVAHFDYDDEIISKNDIKISLKKYNEVEEEIDINDTTQVNIIMKDTIHIKSLDVNLKNYITCDKLTIINNSTYIISKDQINVWQMSHLTKKLKMTIFIPNGYKIDFKSFSLNKKSEDMRITNNTLLYSYNDWILPLSGFAWKLIKI